MEDYKYSWIANHFDRICLSLDGDRNAHDFQRRHTSGTGTYPSVMAALRILSENRKIPVIRITVTRHNAHLLAPIMTHFIDDLGLREFQVEPVYRLSVGNALYPEPDIFVFNFLRAKKIVSRAGGMINYSGYRSNQQHGPYCNFFKNVLFIGRRGIASACLFKDDEAIESLFAIGHYDVEANRFLINTNKVRDLECSAHKLYLECVRCEVQDSCVRGCPDLCRLSHEAAYPVTQSLRCRINRLLFEYEKHEVYNSGVCSESVSERSDTTNQYH
ncbi:MAG: hypothetical protein ACOY90_08115 [Candidatus Zhuqueibacterota bacterium]